MSDFMKMDIFFVATTIVVLVVGVLAAWVLWRVERILRHVEHISEQAAMEADVIRQDIAEMRSSIKQGTGRITSLFSFFTNLTKRVTKKKS